MNSLLLLAPRKAWKSLLVYSSMFYSLELLLSVVWIWSVICYVMRGCDECMQLTNQMFSNFSLPWVWFLASFNALIMMMVISRVEQWTQQSRQTSNYYRIYGVWLLLRLCCICSKLELWHVYDAFRSFFITHSYKVVSAISLNFFFRLSIAHKSDEFVNFTHMWSFQRKYLSTHFARHTFSWTDLIEKRERVKINNMWEIWEEVVRSLKWCRAISPWYRVNNVSITR